MYECRKHCDHKGDCSTIHDCGLMFDSVVSHEDGHRVNIELVAKIPTAFASFSVLSVITLRPISVSIKQSKDFCNRMHSNFY